MTTAPAPQAADPNTGVQAEIDRLTVREAELVAEIAALREINAELRTAADFAASDAAGYIDRTGLETP